MGLCTTNIVRHIHRTLSGVMCDFPIVKRGRGRAARRGRRPLDLVGPSSDAVVILVPTFLGPPSFLLVGIAATAFENILLQCSSFKRASRSLAKTGFK